VRGIFQAAPEIETALTRSTEGIISQERSGQDEARAMLTSHQKLREYWTAQGLKISSGASEEDVVTFESRNGVVLPQDFRNYFLKINGMVQDFGSGCDRKGFAFCPLSMVKSVAKECAKHPTVPVHEEEEADRYFVFADYLQWCWAYAIHLDASSPGTNQVINVGTLRPKVVADSFTEFVNLYVRDARELYPNPQA
jgi:hypothetical protein